jgi:hypothetical protein
MTLDIRVDEAATGARMRADGATLRQRFDEAGLTLSAFHITHGDTDHEQENAG